ncbi:SDR family NAD(P)-dependent oxidoreductase [Burkholderia pyrrocinia]|uniref:SDR family NAD(P)-dependent oxidoreductase n=1 Tax=Burkholderia pyrrocinia TaxID=60550 RepID=UPI0038B4F817
MGGSMQKNIVITGASNGLGRALAIEYAAPGIVLGLIGRDDERLEATARDCRALGASTHIGRVDVRDAAAMADWLCAFDDLEPIDLLISNAGVASTLRSASDWEGLERTAAIVNTNFFGVIHAVLPVIERMRTRRRGQIAMISSLAAFRGMAISPAYCASKSAVRAYADSVRPLLVREGIAVSVVFPGFVQTAMSDVFPGEKPFMWSAERAARYIRYKVGKRNTEIAFPMVLAVGMRLLSILPAKVADAILGRLSYLPRKEI